MQLRRVHFIGLVAVAVGLLMLNSTMPTDDDSVAGEFLRQFAEHLPEAHAEQVADELFLINMPGGEVHRVDLAGMQRDCKERPRSCGNEIASAVITTSDAVDGTSMAGGTLSIRPVVDVKDRRPDVMVSAVEAGLSGPLQPELIIESLASDLVVRYELHTDYSGLPIGQSQLQSLNLTSDVLRGIALENMRSVTRLRSQPLPGYPGVHELLASFEVSTMLIDLPRLSEVIEAGDQRAWIAVPQREKLFYVLDEGGLPELERAVADFTRKDEERLTRELFVVRHGHFDADTQP